MSLVRWFAELALADRSQVGGKGASLGELMRAGIAGPPGFVVTTEAFERAIAQLEHEAPLRERVDALDGADLDAIGQCSRELRRRVEQVELPADLRDALGRSFAQLCGAGGAVAVRSSATTEDAADASFAGLQDTYLWITSADSMLERLRECWGSLYSVESISYRRRRGYAEAGVAMAVVVQQMVDARSAGVMFTRSPLTGDRSVVTIEGSFGLGSTVVSGEVTPDRWVLSKITGEISSRDISDKAIRCVPEPGGGTRIEPVPDPLRHEPCASDEELQKLRVIARAVERHYGCAQDIEWAIEESSGEILLLQSRPETVWSTRESAPAARAAGNPLAHVMSIFGGRK